jgi:hypothetical protein
MKEGDSTTNPTRLVATPRSIFWRKLSPIRRVNSSYQTSNRLGDQCRRQRSYEVFFIFRCVGDEHIMRLSPRFDRWSDVTSDKARYFREWDLTNLWQRTRQNSNEAFVLPLNPAQVALQKARNMHRMPAKESSTNR